MKTIENKSKRFSPQARYGLDGKKWWVVYDKITGKYSSFLCHGKFSTKFDCIWAINANLHLEDE